MTTHKMTATERQLSRLGSTARDTHNDPFTTESASGTPSATERQLTAASEAAERAARRARGRAHRAKVLAVEAASM